MVAVVSLAGCAGGSDPAAFSASPSASAPPSSASPGPSSPSPTPSSVPVATSGRPSASATASFPPARAVILPVPADQWDRIVAVGAWRAGCPVGRDGLRRVEVGYVGFDGRPHRGALVVNADVAASVARIFTALYDARFPIHRMIPIEAYGGDDNVSMAADDTSAYNCRTAAQANAPSVKSPHANGRAIDVNPYENPWVDVRCHCFSPDAYFGTHRSGQGVIVKGGVAWRIFTAEGWIWQDIATPDFMHFDTGYPSHPLAR